MIKFETSLGEIHIKLHEDKTPNTCENFKKYVTSGHYNDCIFHRVIKGFVIQAGGFTAEMQEKQTGASIENEANMGGSNKRGTLAMARTMDPHSASAQFFINLKDNDFLNYKSSDIQGWGYCVFGEVTEGMDIVDKIAAVQTTSKAGHDDVPAEPVVIKSAVIVE
ncbi:MAG: peptidylprolyl isomerase [Legionellales bacterium]|nr:peptidylprolyl isomerase [Legionellales bacterium]|tara:strand:- start:1399 stop:1893 length:495 start_codon:yes stop_codon:yes gene_type:complete